MSDTAQNKDEVGAILEKIIPCQDCGGYVSDHDGVQGDCNYDAGTKIVDEATKAIDDFYRNKILEARKDSLKKLVSDMDEMGRLTQYKQIRTHTIKCIDDITAQFNSTEGCGICGDGGHSAFACTNQSQSTKQESR